MLRNHPNPPVTRNYSQKTIFRISDLYLITFVISEYQVKICFLERVVKNAKRKNYNREKYQNSKKK